MVIANPIYDVVFKKLMENERVAKFFIGTLLDEIIETIEVKPQELTYTDDQRRLALFRLDFIATIKTETGSYKKVLIEIQKANRQIDLMRFRNYLAEQYKKEDTVNDEKIILPITTIYLLGFKLPEIDTPCIRVERNYKDLINHTIITRKSDFVEKLSHDCYVVQVGRITNRYQTRLDKLLSVFEQSNFIDDGHLIKEYKHTADIEEVKVMTDILHYAGTEPEEKQKLENEQELWRTYYGMFGDELNAAEKALNASLKVVEEQNQALEEKTKVLEEQRKTMEEMARQLEDMKRKLNEK